MYTARDCFAMTCKRNGISHEFISDSLSHSDIRVTSSYLDSMSIDESFSINNKLLKRKNGNGKKKDGETEVQSTENV